MDGWIVIPNWDKFQHYKDRGPTWIKLYTRLQSDEDWLNLSLPERGLLASIWLEYARANGEIMTRNLYSRLGQRVWKRHLKALEDAGWIEISASRPLALRYQNASPEKEKEKEPPKPPVNGGPVKLSEKELRRYTGCAWRRGSHGATYVHEILGTDKPPADWPYPKPTREEVELHLEIQDR